MKLKIRCIGHGNSDLLQQEFLKQQKRISSPFSLEMQIFPHSKSKNITTQKKEEADLLQKNIPSNAYLIATAINGSNFSTEQLYDLACKHHDIILFIGGCNGLDSDLIAKCHKTWSLSNLTLTHSMVRLIIAEQWYRINCIYRNHPYHK